MSDDEIAWVTRTAILTDSIVFIWVGRFGPQPLLFPRHLIHGRTPSLLPV